MVQRIAFITTMSGVPWGGSEELWAAGAKFALEQGSKVLVVIFDWTKNAESVTYLHASGAEVVARPRPGETSFFSRLGARIMRKINVSPRQPIWVRALKSWSPDIVCLSHGNTYDGFSDTEVVDMLAADAAPRVHICQLNSEFHMPGTSLRETAIAEYRQARKVLFVAQANLDAAERQLAIKLNNAHVIRNPVNVMSSNPPSMPDLHPELKFACVARLDAKYKGHDLLLKALASPVWSSRAWLLNLYGEGKDKEYLARLIETLGLSERVTLLGHVHDVRKIWAENHLLALPSRAEGTPLALVEAMLMGRPAVVTDVGGNGEWIVEGDTGFVAEGISVRSVTAALERAWAARDDLSEMGKRARGFALNNVDPDPGRTLCEYLSEGVSTKR